MDGVVSEGLCETGAVVCPGEKIRQRRKRVAAPIGARERDGVVVVKKLGSYTDGVRSRLVGKTVDNFAQFVETPGWRSRQRSEGSHSRDAYRRPDFVGGRRLKVAVPELSARFVHRARGKRHDVAHSDDLVGVVQVGGCAGSAQAARAARVDAGDVIQAVADAELILVAELMVDLGEEIRAVDRVWIDAGRDLRAGISAGEQPGVDGGDVGRRDGHQAGLVQLPLLEIGEVKGSVGDDRSREAGAVLRLRHGQDAVGQRVRGVEAAVAEIAVEIAVKSIRAALGYDIDVATQRASELGLASGGDHLELIDDTETVERTRERPAASSLSESPSTMKLFEKLRWLPMEMPCPGTAEVSAKSWLAAVLVGETPGITRAASRKLRPFKGRS